MSQSKSHAQNGPFAVPDFAFPKTVITQSDAMLQKALVAGDGPATIRAILNMTIAETAISNDDVNVSLDQIKQVRKESTDSAVIALLNLLEAEIYYDIYEDRKYVYDERNLPLTPLPADYKEWSGEQFRAHINQLCNKALSPTEDLQEVDIHTYDGVIKTDKHSATFYPTLFDFVANRTIEIRKNLTPFSNIFSLLILTPRDLFLVNPRFVLTSPDAKNVLDTYAALLQFHSHDVAPLIMTDINRIEFTVSGIYSTQTTEADARKFELLTDLYKKYRTSEYSIEALLAVETSNLSEEQLTGYYTLVCEAIKAHPRYFRINNLKNVKTRIESKQINISFINVTAPGLKNHITLNSTNANHAKINVYKVGPTDVKSNYGNTSIESKKLPKPVRSIEVDIPGTIPFSAQKKVEIVFDEPGYYCLLLDGEELPYSVDVIHCSTLAGSLINGATNTAVVVNNITGQPVGDAGIYGINRNGRNNIQSIVGSSDADGFFGFKSEANLDYWKPFKESDSYSPLVNFPGKRTESDNSRTDAEIFTDLAVYHPGDTIKFAFVAYRISKEKRELLKHVHTTVVLRNESWDDMMSVEVTTDNMGRAEGSFTIPKDYARSQVSIKCFDSYKSIVVSDYKLPKFEIITESAQQGVPEAGAVKLVGTVKTYSGVPMADVPVELNLSVSQRYWWRMTNPVQFYNAKATTDQAGRFSFELSRELLENSPRPDGLYTAKISATSVDGESHQAIINFCVGKSYAIEYKGSNEICITDPVTLNARVIDGTGETVKTPIKYTIVDANGKTVLSGTIASGMKWSALKPGNYTLKFSALNNEATAESAVTLYHSKGSVSPSTDPIWTPWTYRRATIGAERKGDVLVGVANPDTYILYILSSDAKVIERRWLKLNTGMHRIDYQLPDNCMEAKLTLLALKNSDWSDITIDIDVALPSEHVKIQAESFRDHLIPGQMETWKFRTVNGAGDPVASALLMRMYNSALDAIYSWPWSINFSKYNLASLSIAKRQLRDLHSSTYSKSIYLDYISVSDPEFNTYGRELYYRMNSITSLRECYASSAPIMDRSEVKLMSKLSYSDSAGDFEEAATEDMDAGEVANEVDAEGNTKDSPDFKFREGESLVAFFCPMLSTDDDGRLVYSFQVPNANTTWQFDALTYTKDLACSKYAAKVLANKPIMVQSNLPRFLRTGDRATISASVINNTEERTAVDVVVEIFDPATAQVFNTYRKQLSLAAGEIAPVDVDLTAPSDAPFIGYRIKASNGTFADGEQNAISILPSTTPVIETKPFYMAPDAHEFSLQLPKFASDGRVTLQFCENPTWYVVTALPGLRNDEIKSAPAAAAAIFSAATAEGILKRDKAIADVLRRWTESEQTDSVLVSMLEQNPDLKIVLLSATPWMLDARSDTERMARLALLFNQEEIAKTYGTAIEQLAKLQCTDGGFMWLSWYNESSLWTTYQVLETLGYLRQIGFMPANDTLNKMIAKAVAYVVKEEENHYKKYPNSNFRDLLLVADAWPEFVNTATSKTIIAKEIRKLIADWKDMSINDKATTASLLYRHGHKNVSRQILESLREYAKSTPEKGMWWPSVGDSFSGWILELNITANALEAFAMIEPEGKEIDAIRQWLILQKETRNWGTSLQTARVVTAMLTASKSWLVPAQGVTITIGDEKVAIPETDAALGYFRTDISDLRPSGALLNIDKPGSTPAWGAVYCRYTDVMTDVKAESCEALSITKRILKQIDGRWEEASALKVGDKVKIQLTIKADRAIEYCAIIDDRAACLEPVEQLPKPIIAEGLFFYLENRDAATNIFINRMPKGVYLLEYELWVNNAGTFSSGIATIQSQYAPQITAHSAGSMVEAAR